MTFLIIGIVAGLLSALFGIGGGIVIVPGLLVGAFIGAIIALQLPTRDLQRVFAVVRCVVAVRVWVAAK